jgi:hypothetical protein
LRRDPEFFGDSELVLFYIGKKLADCKAVEALLVAAEIDYAIEVDYYTGGVLFRRQRAGAFFYTLDDQLPKATAALQAAGYHTVTG